MTQRLYYTDSFLCNFDAEVAQVIPGERTAVVLDRTAFYPTSGGQVFDTGLLSANGTSARVVEVAEDESGRILHYIESTAQALAAGQKVSGTIDADRRRDHMQQHSGQHVLSAGFIELFQMPTVSFHMGNESCTIDLSTKAVTAEQIVKAEELANRVVFENRPVTVRFVSVDEARTLGLHKLPELQKDEMRLVEIKDLDLCACGGTHVAHTSQIGPILIRKTEKVKQGVRVEFVCGDRALKTSQKDFAVLTEAAALFSSHIYDIPQQIRKTLDEAKAGQKRQHALLEEIAELQAADLAANAQKAGGFRVVKQVFTDRDLAFIKLLAQKLTKCHGLLALLGSTVLPPAVVFARSADVDVDVRALMKQAMDDCGGRGGGSNDLAQGGVPDAAAVAPLVEKMASELQ
ncbi:MAG TPA: alanine--tRNA ligase-related protein [Terriglobales bacterium]|nr:alanine--tRNA ligase-related protein [Terriglobales bacterium]